MSVRRDDLRRTLWMLRLAVTVGLAVAVIVGVLAAGFWNRHALLTNLLASLLVVVVSVVLIDRELDRRNRGRWNVLAHYVLYDLNVEARSVWTRLGHVLGLVDPSRPPPSVESEAAAALRDTARTSAAARRAFGEPDGRPALGRLIAESAEHGHGLVARWSSIMLASGPFMDLMDSHVELYSRMAWLRDRLHESDGGAAEPPGGDGETGWSAVAPRSSPGDDELATHVVAIFHLAHDLDRATMQLSRDLIPPEWWQERPAYPDRSHRPDRS